MIKIIILIVWLGMCLYIWINEIKINKEQRKFINEMLHGKRQGHEFNKRRMCEHFCKYKDTAETQEDLDMQCEICPLNEL